MKGKRINGKFVNLFARCITLSANGLTSKYIIVMPTLAKDGGIVLIDIDMMHNELPVIIL